MSDEKKQRSIDEISIEYGQLCQKAGHLQYQVLVLSKDLSLVNEQLQNLNFEAAAVKKSKEQKEEQK